MNDRFIQKIKIDWTKIDEWSYLRDVSALRGVEEIEFTNNITFLVGENGTGKSSLLEGIAVACGMNHEGGTKNYVFSTYEEDTELSRAIQIVRGFRKPKTSYFFRAESFFNVATKSEEYESTFGGKDLHRQSHGESFLSFFSAFDRAGIYLMDEPEAALSPQRQLTLFIHIYKMAQEGAQFIIATHSPILLGIPQADIISFDGGEMKGCRYEDTESYQVMEMFINNREALIRNLLGD